MTCIAAVTDGNKVWIGADSAGVAGLSLEVRADEKVWTRRDTEGNIWAFGFTTSFRMGQLLRYEFKLPEWTKDSDRNMHAFMVTKFIPNVRTCLTAGGFQEKENNRETGGTFIVGIKGKIFVVQNDYQVAMPIHAFASVGCGHHLAQGALFVTENKTPEERIQCALEAAEMFSAGVRRPFHIVHT